jgi:[ribosomal protein S5]-alanine N-acetyltransferase
MSTSTDIKIKLRPKKISDAKEDYAWQNDPELARLDATFTIDMPYAQYLSEYNYELHYPTSNRREFAIETLDGKHIGNCVYYNINTIENKAELGIMIGDRDYWDKSYGLVSIKALLDHIFCTTGLEHIYLTTLDWNIRAQKCFLKCGFAECGRVSRDTSTFIIMVIHRQHWQKWRETLSPVRPAST